MKKKKTLFQTIAPHSIAIFRINRDSNQFQALMKHLNQNKSALSERNITAIVLDREVSIETLSETDLALVGLKRVQRERLH